MSVLFWIAVKIDSNRLNECFPFISFVAGYYLFFYGIFPIYAAIFVRYPPYPVNTSPATVAYVTLFLGAQILGYATWRRFRRSIPARSPASLDGTSSEVKLLAFGAVFFHLLFFALPQLAQLPSIPQLRDPLWNFGFAVLAWLGLTGRLSRKQVALWLGLTITKIGLDLSGGLITSSVFSCFILLVAAISLRRGRYVFLTLVSSLLIVSSYGYVKYFHRTVVDGGATNIFAFKPDFSARSLVATMNAVARRSADALVLEKVIELTPATIPYSGRNPMGRAVLDHIPRIFWPEKPKEKMGNAFGRQYGMIGKHDNVTSWNVPWTADFYIANGPVVALLEALVIGIGMSAAVAWMSAQADRVFWFGFYAATLFPLFYQESNFSVMTGSLFWIGAFLMFSYWIARKLAGWWSRTAPLWRARLYRSAL